MEVQAAFSVQRLKRITRLQFFVAHQFQQQGIERCQFGVAAGGAAQVIQKARDFRAVFVFAVAIPQPRENAGHFQMPLHAHPFVPAVERVELCRHG